MVTPHRIVRRILEDIDSAGQHIFSTLIPNARIPPGRCLVSTRDNWNDYMRQRWIDQPRARRPQLDDGHAPRDHIPDPLEQERALRPPIPQDSEDDFEAILDELDSD
jgi:hypothetical protein